MKICLYSKCQKEFEPKKPKAKFCSAKCRVYYSREITNEPKADESKKPKPGKEEKKEQPKKTELNDFWKKRMAAKNGIK